MNMGKSVSIIFKINKEESLQDIKIAVSKICGSYSIYKGVTGFVNDEGELIEEPEYTITTYFNDGKTPLDVRWIITGILQQDGQQFITIIKDSILEDKLKRHVAVSDISGDSKLKTALKVIQKYDINGLKSIQVNN